MSQLYDFQELVDITGLPERTVRYYLAKVLEVTSGTRGRKAFHSEETLAQLQLAKQVLTQYYDPKRGEVKPSLMDFKQWLGTLSAEDIFKMVKMPYRIKPKMLKEISSLLLINQQVEESNVDYSVRMTEESWKPNKEGSKKTTDTAAQYLDRVMTQKQESTPPPASRHRQQLQWQSFQFGKDLEIKIRKRLTPAQKRQLALAGQLLQSMLEEENK